MKISGNDFVSVEVDGLVFDFQVDWEGDYDYDPGVHTYSNGDPGYPPCLDCEVECVEDITDLVNEQLEDGETVDVDKVMEKLNEALTELVSEKEIV